MHKQYYAHPLPVIISSETTIYVFPNLFTYYQVRQQTIKLDTGANFFSLSCASKDQVLTCAADSQCITIIVIVSIQVNSLKNQRSDFHPECLG